MISHSFEYEGHQFETEIRESAEFTPEEIIFVKDNTEKYGGDGVVYNISTIKLTKKGKCLVQCRTCNCIPLPKDQKELMGYIDFIEKMGAKSILEDLQKRKEKGECQKTINQLEG